MLQKHAYDPVLDKEVECSGNAGLQVHVLRRTWTFTLVEKEETLAASSGLTWTGASTSTRGQTGRGGGLAKQRMMGGARTEPAQMDGLGPHPGPHPGPKQTQQYQQARRECVNITQT